LNTKTYLFGSENASAIEMASGTYRYNFIYRLPDEIPGSFEYNHKNNICYRIEAVLDIPWKCDKEFKLSFIVLQNFDLNLFPVLNIRTKTEEEKTFCCLCCRSNSLTMTVSVPQTGFVAGQQIPVTIHYDNQSSVKVLKTIITFTKTVRLYR
jgi:hypothetical protein